MPKLIKEVCGAIVSGALIVWVGAMLLTNDPCERLSRFDWLPAAVVHATVFVAEPFVHPCSLHRANVLIATTPG